MSTPTTQSQMNNNINQVVTLKTQRKSITAFSLGTLLKSIVDFCIFFFVPSSSKGQANGVASLDGFCKIPITQLPSITADIDLPASISAQSSVNMETLGDQYLPTTGGKLGFTAFVETLIGIVGEGGGNVRPESVSIGGEDINNINTELGDVEIEGAFQLNTTCIINDSTFGNSVNKLVMTNIWKTDIAGHVDRLIDCQLLPGVEDLRNAFGGVVEWCAHMFVAGFECVGDVTGIYQVSIQNTECNCKFKNINGTTNHGQEFGFSDCQITGTSSASTFGNIRICCTISGKTITQSEYPELFDLGIEKVLYATPNGNIWYRWYDNSNFIQFTQIV